MTIVGRLNLCWSQLTRASMTSHFSQEQIAKFHKAFSHYDKKADGTIKTKYLGKVMQKLDLDTTEAELHSMTKKVDLDGTGTIHFEQFVSLMAKRRWDIENQAEHEGFHDFLCIE